MAEPAGGFVVSEMAFEQSLPLAGGKEGTGTAHDLRPFLPPVPHWPDDALDSLSTARPSLKFALSLIRRSHLPRSGRLAANAMRRPCRGGEQPGQPKQSGRKHDYAGAGGQIQVEGQIQSKAVLASNSI